MTEGMEYCETNGIPWLLRCLRRQMVLLISHQACLTAVLLCNGAHDRLSAVCVSQPLSLCDC